MIQAICKEHLWGNMVLTCDGEEPKHYTICVDCGTEKPYDWLEDFKKRGKESGIEFDKFLIERGVKPPTNFHIEENLDVVKNDNVFNAEKYFDK